MAITVTTPATTSVTIPATIPATAALALLLFICQLWA